MTAQRLPLAIGTEIRTAPRPMTRERMRWYVDAQPTIGADDGRIHTQPPTIHDDDDYARKNGLPGIISDGMISTNWIQGLLCDVFGAAVASRSRLRTKYIAPIYEDQIVIAVAKIVSVAETGPGVTSYALDVWCEDDTGKKLTVGEALIHVA
ncbi:MaoC family dehydratase [Microbacteriaceae bacterium K1510]|nr:MaoC family dehydratase [Microbacteriaceae bacterium K1510]